jgi:hypothetical protein
VEGLEGLFAHQSAAATGFLGAREMLQHSTALPLLATLRLALRLPRVVKGVHGICAWALHGWGGGGKLRACRVDRQPLRRVEVAHMCMTCCVCVGGVNFASVTVGQHMGASYPECAGQLNSLWPQLHAHVLFMLLQHAAYGHL